MMLIGAAWCRGEHAMAQINAGGDARMALALGGAGCIAVRGDFDGDGAADPAVYQESSGKWTALMSASGYAVAGMRLGGPRYSAVPSDYDGDGKTDPAVYQEKSGFWQAMLSGSGYAVAGMRLGGPGLRPAPADYDGDGKADPAIYDSKTGTLHVSRFGAAPMPLAGVDVPELRSFDTVISEFMRKYGIPGGAVAVTKDERLVYARGFGYADRDTGAQVQPDSLFRIASSSKPITATAVLRLVQDGRLSLDARVFGPAGILSDLSPPPGGSIVDPRLLDVTVRNLLEHSGGWDIERLGYDPQYALARKAADALGVSRPAGAVDIIRYMLGRRLSFTPGTEYSYSNFGYNILGRVIEKASGRTYEQYLQESVFPLAGISGMHLGHTRLRDAYPGEVKYYPPEGLESLWSLYEDEELRVSACHGGDYNVEVMDAHGGWVASVVDLAKFACAVDDRPRRPDILNHDVLRMMLSRPAIPSYAGKADYYAMGWNVRSAQDIWTHEGAVMGTSSIIMRLGADGLSWAAVFNNLPAEKLTVALGELGYATFFTASKGVASWPEHDLFNQYR
jgi:N-acyl-D-amino-acid deacylase